MLFLKSEAFIFNLCSNFEPSGILKFVVINYIEMETLNLFQTAFQLVVNEIDFGSLVIQSEPIKL